MHQLEGGCQKSVAIIGSGLAGLVSAYLLTQDKGQRFDVEVFETVCMCRICWPAGQDAALIETLHSPHPPHLVFVFLFLSLLFVFGILSFCRNLYLKYFVIRITLEHFGDKSKISAQAFQICILHLEL